MKLPLPTHVYEPDHATPGRDGKPGCSHCPLAKSHAVHDLLPTSDAVREHEARRYGERGQS